MVSWFNKAEDRNRFLELLRNSFMFLVPGFFWNNRQSRASSPSTRIDLGNVRPQVIIPVNLYLGFGKVSRVFCTQTAAHLLADRLRLFFMERGVQSKGKLLLLYSTRYRPSIPPGVRTFECGSRRLLLRSITCPVLL